MKLTMKKKKLTTNHLGRKKKHLHLVLNIQFGARDIGSCEQDPNPTFSYSVATKKIVHYDME